MGILKQEKSKDYTSRLVTMSNVRFGTDKLFITHGHEELVSVEPLEGVIILDGELMLTLNDAKGLADNILTALTNAGFIEP